VYVPGAGSWTYKAGISPVRWREKIRKRKRSMDIWEKMYLKAKEEYGPQEVTPFLYAHHVVCALESENGEIYTGFCVESCCGVMDLCAERVAAINMYVNSGQTVIKRLIVFRDQEPREGGDDIPCLACREFLLQLSPRNKDIEIMTDYPERKVKRLEELVPDWWGWKRYRESDQDQDAN